jgi:hypothetical protein
LVPNSSEEIPGGAAPPALTTYLPALGTSSFATAPSSPIVSLRWSAFAMVAPLSALTGTGAPSATRVT